MVKGEGADRLERRALSRMYRETASLARSFCFLSIATSASVSVLLSVDKHSFNRTCSACAFSNNIRE